MSTITTKDGSTIYYKDWGTGPIVGLHLNAGNLRFDVVYCT
jgi:hypothetical protein